MVRASNHAATLAPAATTRQHDYTTHSNDGSDEGQECFDVLHSKYKIDHVNFPECFL